VREILERERERERDSGAERNVGEDISNICREIGGHDYEFLNRRGE
jgi:hypothetical protein